MFWLIFVIIHFILGLIFSILHWFRISKPILETIKTSKKYDIINKKEYKKKYKLHIILIISVFFSGIFSFVLYNLGKIEYNNRTK